MSTYHYTPGEIPLAALTTLGVSVKENTDTAIGQFGTGFKYAVAGVLRACGNITVTQPNGDRYTFDWVEDTIREKTFRIVTLTEPFGTTSRLGFTTDLGAHWQPWMLFRELHSNTLDEGGLTTTSPKPDLEGYACITIENFPEYDLAATQRFEYFLPPSLRPATLGDPRDGVRLYEGARQGVFYRGVRVCTQQELELNLPFTIELTRADLTEDRTLSSPLAYHWNIAAALAALPDFYSFINGRHEKTLPRSTHPKWQKACHEAYKKGAQVPLSIITNLINEEARRASGTPLNPEQSDQVAAILRAFTEKLGISLPAEWKITVSSEIGKHQGLCIFAAKEIKIASSMFDSAEQLSRVLLEEVVHAQTGYGDATRDLENFLFNKLLATHNFPIASDAFDEIFPF